MNRYQVNKAIRRILQEPDCFRAFKEDPQAFVEKQNLAAEEKEAIIKIDYPSLYAAGVHPFLLNGFVSRLLSGDRGKIMKEYREKVASLGYPDFST
ncbi:MAG: hypothetical protein GTO40_15280 [Deltaproteobacteria bacterium]|nr:hypothetical protein [Deltaproteobacteria bacterium]